MKQSLKQKQKLSLNLTLNLKKQIELLSLSGFEIRSNLDDLINEFCKESNNKKLNYFKDEVLTDRIRNTLSSNVENDSYHLAIDQDIDLRKELMDQLVICPLREHEILIGEIIIDSILENGRLDPELQYKDIKKIVKELKTGQFSKPIRTSSGFMILKINDEKEYLSKFNLADKMEEVIRFKTNDQLNQFSSMYLNKIKKDLKIYGL